MAEQFWRRIQFIRVPVYKYDSPVFGLFVLDVAHVSFVPTRDV